jgi:hypothetical protein
MSSIVCVSDKLTEANHFVKYENLSREVETSRHPEKSIFIDIITICWQT